MGRWPVELLLLLRRRLLEACLVLVCELEASGEVFRASPWAELRKGPLQRELRQAPKSAV